MNGFIQGLQQADQANFRDSQAQAQAAQRETVNAQRQQGLDQQGQQLNQQNAQQGFEKMAAIAGNLSKFDDATLAQMSPNIKSAMAQQFGEEFANTLPDVLTQQAIQQFQVGLAQEQEKFRVQSSTNFDGVIQQVGQDGSVRVIGAGGNQLEGDAAQQAIQSAVASRQDRKLAQARNTGNVRIDVARETSRLGIDGAQEKAANAARGKSQVERSEKFINEGLTAAESLPNIKRSIELLGSVETGGIDAVRIRAKQMFGIESADEAELSNALGKAVISQYRTVFGAQFTENEGNKLDAIEAGMGKSVAGNLRQLKQLEKLVERKARRGIAAATDSDDSFNAKEIQDLLDFKLDDTSSQKKQQNSFTSSSGVSFTVE